MGRERQRGSGVDVGMGQRRGSWRACLSNPVSRFGQTLRGEAVRAADTPCQGSRRTTVEHMPFFKGLVSFFALGARGKNPHSGWSASWSTTQEAPFWHHTHRAHCPGERHSGTQICEKLYTIRSRQRAGLGPLRARGLPMALAALVVQWMGGGDRGMRWPCGVAVGVMPGHMGAWNEKRCCVGT